MAHERNRASKADVQSTELNKMPAGEEQNAEISAQAAAEVFRNSNNNEQQQNESME
ncbi:MAG TPA: hypothetical protein VMS09_08910 [Paenibacillus sp.]|uniref:hypothetical protein n=1 Tax=Paenibacillus sp. TaxID=58172 RepID=UPI002BFB5B62|nr:hypothetical protein [Paenibacillus sp.]HUC92133.1 hypothetical protein [Paenibacillus sp.]